MFIPDLGSRIQLDPGLKITPDPGSCTLEISSLFSIFVGPFRPHGSETEINSDPQDC
jgi:hypothetical protein